MSLLSAFSNARSSMQALSVQTALISRNIGNVDNPNASRKYANVVTAASGGVRINSIARAEDPSIYRTLIAATSAYSSAKVGADALNAIRTVVGDTDQAGSPAATIAALKDALAAFAITPEDAATARAAADAARGVATSLNKASDAVQTARQTADDELALAASSMNALLKELESVNGKVVVGTRTGADVTDALDRRDSIVAELSQYVGVTVQTRAGNDMVLYTDSGTTLFEKTARAVEFSPTTAYGPSTTGGDFRIDGVSVYGGASPMPIKSGSVFANLTFRDETAVTFQSQLDQLARGLVDAFSETSQTDPAVSADGLFTGFDSETTLGLAGRLQLSEAVDPTKGGDPTLIRDGGINGADFVYNTEDNSGFTGRLNELVAAFSEVRDFDPAAGAGDRVTLGGYAAASIGWLEGRRSDALANAEYGSVLLTRTQETLSNATGINLDDEMTRLLDLERSYQASTKLITTVGDMLDALIASV